MFWGGLIFWDYDLINQNEFSKAIIIINVPTLHFRKPPLPTPTNLEKETGTTGLSFGGRGKRRN